MFDSCNIQRIFSPLGYKGGRKRNGTIDDTIARSGISKLIFFQSGTGKRSVSGRYGNLKNELNHINHFETRSATLLSTTNDY